MVVLPAVVQVNPHRKEGIHLQAASEISVSRQCREEQNTQKQWSRKWENLKGKRDAERERERERTKRRAE